MIIEINPLPDARPCFPAVGVGFQMDLFVLALIAKFVEIGYTSDRGRGLGRRGWNWGNLRSGFRVCRA